MCFVSVTVVALSNVTMLPGEVVPNQVTVPGLKAACQLAQHINGADLRALGIWKIMGWQEFQCTAVGQS